jgi:hypothetical protein
VLDVVYLGSHCDSFLLYGISEMSSRLGIEFKRVFDSRDIPKNPLALIVPEASYEKDYLEDLLADCQHSVLLIGPHGSPKLDELFGVKQIGEKDSYPDVTGLMKSSRLPNPIPVFYKIPLLQKNDPAVEVVADIEIEKTTCPSVVLRRENSRLLARIGPQVFRSAAFLLTKSGFQASPIVEPPKLDSFGRVPLRSTITHRRGYLRTPVIDYYARILEDILLEIASSRSVPLLQKWPTPGPYNFCLSLSHDVDYLAPNPTDLVVSILFDISEANFRRVVGRIVLAFFYAVSAIMTRNRDLLALIPQALHRRLRKYDPFWRLDEIRKLEAQFGIRSSFFFLHNENRMDSNYDLKSNIVRSAIRQTSSEGFEVCLHADFGATDAEKLQWRKRAIEDAADSSVIGVRAHYLRISYPDTFRLYARAGLAYDSSVMFSEEVGYRSSTCMPWKVFDIDDQKTLPILEIPPIIMDRTLQGKGHMNLSPDAARRICSALIEQVADLHGVLTVDWHNSELSLRASLDREWWGVYKSIIEESIKRGSRVMKLDDVFAYYNRKQGVRMEVVRCDRKTCDIEILCEQAFPDFAMSVSTSDTVSYASLDGESSPKCGLTKFGGNRWIVTVPLKNGDNRLSLSFGP